MNTDAKFLSKLLANWIHQHIKESYTVIKQDERDRSKKQTDMQTYSGACDPKYHVEPMYLFLLFILTEPLHVRY